MHVPCKGGALLGIPPESTLSFYKGSARILCGFYRGFLQRKNGVVEGFMSWGSRVLGFRVLGFRV